MAYRHSSTRGFKRTGSLLNDQIRKAGESRGFAVSRLLTHWEEIVGPELAAMARPVRLQPFCCTYCISVARGGCGGSPASPGVMAK